LIGHPRIAPGWLFALPAILLSATLDRGFSFAQSACPIGAAAEVHYGPGEDLEKIDVVLIREGLELRSSALGGELMRMKGYCVNHRLLRTARPTSAGQADPPGQRPRGAQRRVDLRRI
jgi:hypothetical protein